MKNRGTLILETSGLDPASSDILQVVLTGEPGFAGTYGAVKCKSWDASINRLMPDAVNMFPAFSKEDANRLGQAIARYDQILVYNEDFIYDFLSKNSVAVLPGVFTDVMKLYSEKFGSDSYEKRVKALADYRIQSTESGPFAKALSITELYERLTAKTKKGRVPV